MEAQLSPRLRDAGQPRRDRRPLRLPRLLHRLRIGAGCSARAVLLANWPFTLLAIMPTNKRLDTIALADAGVESRTLLVKWGELHAIRSTLGIAAA